MITVCGTDFCPAAYLGKVEEWNVESPRGKSLEEVRKIRNCVQRKVTDLIERLEKE